LFHVAEKKSYMGCAFSSINAAFWALQMKKLGRGIASLPDYKSTFPKWPSVVNNNQVLFIIANSGVGF